MTFGNYEEGILKVFHEDGGWGFIMPNQGGGDVYCHLRNNVAFRQDAQGVTAISVPYGRGRERERPSHPEGDRILFRRYPVPREKVAIEWGRRSEYEAVASQTIAKR